MGKGFNNYMCKKFFHPASRDNLKRVWIAQQKDDAYRKKQEELRMQYEKEQDLYNNKALLSKESKDKLSVNFMYEPPPGAKKEREKEDNEPEYKFEWQRKYNAPREDYCKGDSEIQDQPFGILVRNVRCIRCRKWGHINTDKECPLYNQATVSQIATEKTDASSLLQQMKEDGLKLKKSALEAQQHIDITCPADSTTVQNDDEDKADKSEINFLMGLSTKKKIKLLKQLEKLEKLEKSNKKKKRKKKSRKESETEDSSSSSASSSSSPSSSSSSSSEDEKPVHRREKEKKRSKTENNENKEKRRRKRVRQAVSGDRDSSDEEPKRKHKKKRRNKSDKKRHGMSKLKETNEESSRRRKKMACANKKLSKG